MKPFDPTTRCQNCGGLRKEHHIRKPYKCPTRLTVSYWEPWTMEAYEAAEKTGQAAARAKESKRSGLLTDMSVLFGDGGAE